MCARILERISVDFVAHLKHWKMSKVIWHADIKHRLHHIFTSVSAGHVTMEWDLNACFQSSHRHSTFYENLSLKDTFRTTFSNCSKMPVWNVVTASNYMCMYVVTEYRYEYRAISVRFNSQVIRSGLIKNPQLYPGTIKSRFATQYAWLRNLVLTPFESWITMVSSSKVYCPWRRISVLERKTYLPPFVISISVWCSLNLSHCSLLRRSTFMTSGANHDKRAANRSQDRTLNDGKSNKPKTNQTRMPQPEARSHARRVLWNYDNSQLAPRNNSKVRRVLTTPEESITDNNIWDARHLLWPFDGSAGIRKKNSQIPRVIRTFFPLSTL